MTSAITERLCEIVLAWNAQELLFGPCKEGRDFRLTQRLTRSMANVRGLTVNAALNIVEFAYPVERLAGDLGLV